MFHTSNPPRPGSLRFRAGCLRSIAAMPRYGPPAPEPFRAHKETDRIASEHKCESTECDITKSNSIPSSLASNVLTYKNLGRFSFINVRTPPFPTRSVDQPPVGIETDVVVRCQKSDDRYTRIQETASDLQDLRAGHAAGSLEKLLLQFPTGFVTAYIRPCGPANDPFESHPR